MESAFGPTMPGEMTGLMRKNVGWSILEVAVVSNALELELVSRLVVQASDNGSFKPITTC